MTLKEYNQTKKELQIKKEIYDAVGCEYEFLELYAEGYETKIKLLHTTCGRVYSVSSRSFLKQGKRCVECYRKSLAWSTEKFKLKVSSLAGDEYSVLGEYVNSKTKIELIHNACGHIYLANPGSFIKGNRCPKCGIESSRLKNTKTNDEFLAEIFSLVGDEYTVLETYKNTNTKISIRHNACGYEYSVRPDAFISGGRCRPCRNRQLSVDNTKTTEHFANEVASLTNDEYKLVGDYVNVNTKVSVKHVTCGHEYEVYPFLFQRGRRCPNCNKSKGEQLVEYVLQNNNIEYEAQTTFEDLIHIKRLSYDFYLPQHNMLIEYQGVQHYQPVDLFGGEVQFKLQQKHDTIKREYAVENKYKLIEIPYTADTYSTVADYLTGITDVK